MENSENQSSLQALFFVLRRRILVIFAIAIASALVFGLLTVFFVDPVYSSKAKFYVNNTQDPMTSVSQQDLSASKSLAESCIVIIKNSTKLLKTVIKASGVDCTPAQLRANLAAGTYSGTEAFYVSVSSTDPNEAYELAKTFYEIIPDEIHKIIKKGDVSTIDPPEKPKAPDSPNVTLNCVFGAVIGFAVAFVVFFLKEMLDNTIYTEEDIKDKFGYPIIGVIPTIVTDQNVKSQSGIGFKKERSKNV